MATTLWVLRIGLAVFFTSFEARIITGSCSAL
jgi:hypothetical protein